MDAVIRWSGREPDTPPPPREHPREWQYRRFPLIDSLDWIGITELEFRAHQRYLDVEVGLVPKESSVSGPEALDWGTLDEQCRGSVRRAAPAGREFSFIFGSCRHRGYGPLRRGDHAFQTMTAEDLHRDADFLLLGGDQVYCDHPLKFFRDFLDFFPCRPPASLDVYFEKYYEYFQADNFRRLLRSLPVYMIFDDHEIRNNWAGYRYCPAGDTGNRSRPPWSRNTLEWGLRSYLAYQAIHSPLVSTEALRDPATKPVPNPQHWWYTFEWGDADFMVLDTRSDRTDPTKPLSAGKNGFPVLLGTKQWEELKTFLRANPERYKFVVSPVPLAPDTRERRVSRADTWRAYPQQRRELLDFIADNVPTFPVFLSGDLHISRVVSIRREERRCFIVPCIMSSALNWFVFGTQNRGGPLGYLFGRIEDGRLPVTGDELRRHKGRKGPYFTRFETEGLVWNNFVQITVKGDGISVQIVKVKNGERQQSWAYEIPRDHLTNPYCRTQ